MLRKFRRHHLPHLHHCRKPSRLVRRIKDWIKSIFGVKPHTYQKISEHEEHDAWTSLLEIDGEDVRAVSPFSHHSQGGTRSEHQYHKIGQRKPKGLDSSLYHRELDHPMDGIHTEHSWSDHELHLPEDTDLPKPGNPRFSNDKHQVSSRPPKNIKKLVKAAKRIVKVNKKIMAFERGFISEDGIKDREWYKNLGVAPGKWLGKSFVTRLQ